MANINDLRKYEIEALVNEELYREEPKIVSKSENNFLHEARSIIQKMIRYLLIKKLKI